MKPILCVGLLLLTVIGFAQSKAMEQVDAKKLATLEKAHLATKAVYDKKPKDAKAKQAYVNAALAFGLGSMYSADLPARIKYKQALTHFRTVLKLDPKNKVAKQQYELIAAIYKQMGRPIPNS